MTLFQTATPEHPETKRKIDPLLAGACSSIFLELSCHILGYRGSLVNFLCVIGGIIVAGAYYYRDLNRGGRRNGTK